MKKLFVSLWMGFLISITITPEMASAFLFNVYTDQTLWEAAVVSHSLENFNDHHFNDGQFLGGSINTIAGHRFLGRVAGTTLGPGIKIAFDDPIWAFGGIWDLVSVAAFGIGDGLAITAENGMTYEIGEISNSYLNSFWGFVADSSFDTVGLYIGNQIPGQNIAETFFLDDVVYSSEVAPIPNPEPSTFLLLGGGLAGLAFIAWRKKRA